MSRKSVEREKAIDRLVQITDRLEHIVATLETHVDPEPPAPPKENRS